MTDEFDSKDPSEKIPLTFDFSSLTTEELSNPTITISYHSGPKTTADLSAMLLGSAQVTAQTVIQKVQGGLAGAVYKVRCQVDTATSLRYVLSGLLPVETA